MRYALGEFGGFTMYVGGKRFYPIQKIELFADRLATAYLRQRMEEGKSAWALKTERSALRLFFGDRTLIKDLELPERKRENIKRSRLPAKRDKQINLDNWQHAIQFCLACGLRREELRDLYARGDG